MRTVTVPALALATLLIGLSAHRGHALTAPQDPAPPTRLALTPEIPPPGSTVTVAYHPAETLAGAPLLILRGHFRLAGHADSGLPARNRRIATLTPAGDGSYHASFTLPERAAYAEFVVEDAAGERIDTRDGRHFELLIHGDDGEERYEALVQRAGANRDRDPALARESIEQAVEIRRRIVAGESPGSEVTVTISDSPTILSQGDLDRMELPPELGWTRTWMRWEQDGNSVAALQQFEDQWPGLEGKRTGVGNHALRIAVQSRDPDAADRWAERILDEGWTDPWADKLMVAKMIASLPERLERARELARAAMADFEAVDPVTYPGRPLGQTASDYAGVLFRDRLEAMIDNHRLLSDAGFEDGVIDALEAAGNASGESGHFRKLGELRLARGDTGGAARAFAVVASDPGTLPARARLLARRAGYDADGPEWRRLLQTATAEVLPRVRAQAVRRPLTPVTLADGEGERLSLERIVDGKPTVVVFWARWCGPCIAEIPEVARLATLVDPHGVQVVSVSTDDPPGPEMEAWLIQRRVTYPVYYDLDGEAGDVFDVETIPVVFILDGDGTVRFESTHIATVPRQLEALGLLR